MKGEIITPAMPQEWVDHFARLSTDEIAERLEIYNDMLSASRRERRYYGVRMSHHDLEIVRSLYSSALAERTRCE